jgi:hypothetical protein
MGEANKDIQEAVKEQGENAISRAVMEQEQAAEHKDQTTANLTELQTLNDLHKAEVNRLVEEQRPLMDAVQKFRFHDHWSDGNTGNAVLAAIASGLLGFGTGQYHNVAMEIAKNDHERQVNEFNSLLERARLGGGDMDRLLKTQEQGMSAMTMMQAAKYNAIADKYAEMGKQAGTVEAQTAARLGEAQARKLAAAEMAKYYEGLRTRGARNVSRSTPKPMGAKPTL